METKKKTVRTPEEIKKMTDRLSRIEGQIRGIKKMLEEDAYCTDIITQISAASAALSSFNRELLATHIMGCVARDIQNNDMSSSEEIYALIKQVTK